MLCMLVKEQSAQVDMESFDGNPLGYTYFMSKFWESVEKKIEDPKVDWHDYFNILQQRPNT